MQVQAKNLRRFGWVQWLNLNRQIASQCLPQCLPTTMWFGTDMPAAARTGCIWPDPEPAALTALVRQPPIELVRQTKQNSVRLHPTEQTAGPQPAAAVDRPAAVRCSDYIGPKPDRNRFATSCRWFDQWKGPVGEPIQPAGYPAYRHQTHAVKWPNQGSLVAAVYFVLGGLPSCCQPHCSSMVTYIDQDQPD